MARSAIILAAFALALLAFQPEALALTCAPKESTILNLNERLYLTFDLQVWSDANGLDGLQRTAGTCADGFPYGADRKVAP